MKIYINSYHPDEILEKIKKIDNYFNKSINYIEIISNDGLFKIENSQLFKMNVFDQPVLMLKNFYKNLVLFIDKSYYKTEKIFSQIPYNHDIRNITCFYYDMYNNINMQSNKKSSKNNNIQFVVEGTYKESQIQLQMNSNNMNSKYYNFVPHDFYFLVNEDFDFDNIFCKEELNVFLSHLF